VTRPCRQVALALAVAVALLVTGCGSDEPGTPADTVSTPITTSEAPASELSAAPSPDGGDGFLIYTQWHQEANSGSPNIDLWVTDGDDPEIRMSVRGGLLGGDVSQYTAVYDLGPLVLGEWLDHTVRIRWSPDPDEGDTRVWIDGDQKVHAVAANLYEGQSVYFKQGIYAANNTSREHTVYFTDARRGPSRESVALVGEGD
jgi:hypothetical protein